MWVGPDVDAASLLVTVTGEGVEVASDDEVD